MRLSVSNDVSSGSKTAEFKPNEKAIFWGIKKMQGGAEHFGKFKVSTKVCFFNRFLSLFSSLSDNYIAQETFHVFR